MVRPCCGRATCWRWRGGRRAPGAAEAVTGRLDVPAAFARRDYMTSGWHDDGQARWLESTGIALIRGTGRLTGERAVEVQTAGGAALRLRAARAVVLATGSTAVIPPVPGLAEARAWDNRAATSAKEVPRRLLVLGGGAVGAELAQAFRRLGSEEVVVLEGSDRLLAREESFAGEELRAAFEAEGITVVTGARVAAWTTARDEIRAAILEHGWNSEVGAFTQAFGGEDLDASNLMMAITGFLPGDDPRMKATIDATAERLTDKRGLVYRYLAQDGLAGEEGTFLLCTFWLAQAQAMAGEVDQAVATFERAVSAINDVGLLAEEIDADGEMIGNFPQAFSHIGLVNAAWAISQAQQRRN